MDKDILIVIYYVGGMVLLGNLSYLAALALIILGGLLDKLLDKLIP